MANSVNTLDALSPLDGRYHSKLTDLSQLFSEHALIKKRVVIEIAYILFLSEQKIISPFTVAQQKKLLTLQTSFTVSEAEKVKIIESKIKHDVKAVEYYLRDFFVQHSIPNAEFIHFALTSEDSNALAYSLMLQEAKQTIIIPNLHQLLLQLVKMAKAHAATPLLAKTHGQPAVPTTIGKELIVFANRLFSELQILRQQSIAGKLTGAVGNFNAHAAAFPHYDWPTLSQQFVQTLGLQPELVTTQIIPAETYSHFFSSLIHINALLLDLNQDIWRYISDGVFLQKVERHTVGSSTMPQKINPIDFENSEGNLGLANALLLHFIQKLPISRLQRDLSDSTVKRSFGTALAHCQLAYQSLFKGLTKISVNQHTLQGDLNKHWEVVTEGIQVVLKTHGQHDAYELLKTFSRGEQFSEKNIVDFIDSLSVANRVKKQLRSITPQSYIGLAKEITIENVNRINNYLQGAA